MLRVAVAVALCAARAAATRRRFASMCIASPSLAPKQIDALARRCALQVCSLLLTTAPEEKPLVLAHGLSTRHVAWLERAGAEVAPSPGLAPWNATGPAWAGRPPSLKARTEPERLYTRAARAADPLRVCSLPVPPPRSARGAAARRRRRRRGRARRHPTSG